MGVFSKIEKWLLTINVVEPQNGIQVFKLKHGNKWKITFRLFWNYVNDKPPRYDPRSVGEGQKQIKNK